MKQTIKDIILENQNTNLPDVNPRSIDIPINLNLIISIIGARRSGKTYILYQLIYKLLKQNIKKEQILFINLEDERLKLKTESLDLILQAYQELFPDINFKDVYFFFDEIQNIEGWEKFIRRIYDTKNRKIFITGSNSKLLSTEIATELRGRSITFTVYPLSFIEYLQFHNIKPNLFPQQNKSKIVHYAQKFLSEGGFPELVHYNSKIRLRILQQYFNIMIFRDIIERYKISNPEVLKFFIKKIFAGVTKPFSVNKAYNDLKSLGYKISNKYLYEYITHCNTVFLTQSINKFHYSEIKQEKSDKKTYVIDTGLLSAIEFSVSKNYGKLLENAVAMEFLKSEKKLFYFNKYHECDFIVENNNKYFPVQVTYSLKNEQTKTRELKGLYEACTYLKTDKGIIITFEEEDEIKYKNISIKIIPFYKYFLK